LWFKTGTLGVFGKIQRYQIGKNLYGEEITEKLRTAPMCLGMCQHQFHGIPPVTNTHKSWSYQESCKILFLLPKILSPHHCEKWHLICSTVHSKNFHHVISVSHLCVLYYVILPRDSYSCIDTSVWAHTHK
jgi:hypothetical protein